MRKRIGTSCIQPKETAGYKHSYRTSRRFPIWISSRNSTLSQFAFDCCVNSWPRSETKRQCEYVCTESRLENPIVHYRNVIALGRMLFSLVMVVVVVVVEEWASEAGFTTNPITNNYSQLVKSGEHQFNEFNNFLTKCKTGCQ